MGHSAVPELSLSENILLSQFPKNNFIKNGIILKNNVDDFANNVINEFKVITPGNDAKASSLSEEIYKNMSLVEKYHLSQKY